MLSLKTEDIDIENFGFRHSDVSMSLRVENPNLFALAVSDVVYELIIGKIFAWREKQTMLLLSQPGRRLRYHSKWMSTLKIFCGSHGKQYLKKSIPPFV